MMIKIGKYQEYQNQLGVHSSPQEIIDIILIVAIEGRVYIPDVYL